MKSLKLIFIFIAYALQFGIATHPSYRCTKTVCHPDSCGNLPYGGGILSADGHYVPESIPCVWDYLISELCKRVDKRGQSILKQIEGCFSQFNSFIIAGNSCGVAETLNKSEQLCIEFGPYILNSKVVATFHTNINQMDRLKRRIAKSGKVDLKGLNALFKDLSNDTYEAMLNHLI